MNKKDLAENKTLDSILTILLSADESESKPELIRSILSQIIGLVQCGLATMHLGRCNDLERYHAALNQRGIFNFQPIGEEGKSPASSINPNPKTLSPLLVPHGVWPSQPCLWSQGEVHPEGLKITEQWSSWLRTNALGTEIRSILVQPFSRNLEPDGLIALAFSEPDHPTPEQRIWIAQSAPFIGRALNNWHNLSALRERVKELSCLYGLARLLDPPGRTLEEVLQGVVELLPPAWLYAQDASARIEYGGQEFFSPDYRPGLQKQSAELVVGGRQAGTVEVSYSEHKPLLDEGPFLVEERKLLDNVARQTAQCIERFLYESEKSQIMDKLRQADSMAMMGQVAATVAHEINEPLTSILGYAQLAAASPHLPPQISPDIEKVVATSLHMREIVRKTLLYSRRIPPKVSKVDLNEAVKVTLELFEWRCRREGITHTFKPSGATLAITADPGQIRQIVTNLTINAIQSMPDGGELRLKTFSEQDWVGFSVADTGSGMTEEVVDKIFIPFFSTKEAGRGTGLGLSVVHDIVTELGGEIDVQSKPGSGTIIKVRFPHPTNHLETVEAGECGRN